MGEVKGVISEISGGTYGSSDPFGDNLMEVIPTNTTQQAPAAADAPVQDEKEGDGYLMYSLWKENFPLDELEIGKDADLKTALAKISEAYDKKAETKAEEIARSKGWTDENFRYAKMLDMGLSPAEQSELARLNAYSKVKVDLDDEVSVQNSKHIIEEMYRDKLSGRALQKAIEGVDTLSEEFPDLAKEAVEYFSSKKNTVIDAIEAKKAEEDRQINDFDGKIRSSIESGDVYGVKLEKDEVKKYIDKIYTPTETLTVKENGKDVVRKVSKYEKVMDAVSKDPAMMGRLMMFIADELKNDLAFEAGKAEYANELEAKLAGRFKNENRPQRATSLGTVRDGNIIRQSNYY